MLMTALLRVQDFPCSAQPLADHMVDQPGSCCADNGLMPWCWHMQRACAWRHATVYDTSTAAGLHCSHQALVAESPLVPCGIACTASNSL